MPMNMDYMYDTVVSEIMNDNLISDCHVFNNIIVQIPYSDQGLLSVNTAQLKHVHNLAKYISPRAPIMNNVKATKKKKITSQW